MRCVRETVKGKERKEEEESAEEEGDLGDDAEEEEVEETEEEEEREESFEDERIWERKEIRRRTKADGEGKGLGGGL